MAAAKPHLENAGIRWPSKDHTPIVAAIFSAASSQHPRGAARAANLDRLTTRLRRFGHAPVVINVARGFASDRNNQTTPSQVGSGPASPHEAEAERREYWRQRR